MGNKEKGTLDKLIGTSKIRGTVEKLAIIVAFSAFMGVAYLFGIIKSFATGRLAITVVMVLFSFFIWFSSYITELGKKWYIRPIDALQLIEEGVGRSAEMDRPVMNCPGMSGISSSLTLAGLSISGEVIQRAVELGVRPLNLTASTDVTIILEGMVNSAFTAAGKSDLYKPGEYVFWTGGEQFAYATYVMGAIMHEKPALIVFVGSFLSDIMMNTETGKRVGAIEIGGTSDTTAMATMAMICDGILIGEEMYAAAAVISKDEKLAGSIAGQDWAFVVTVAILIIGIIAVLSGSSIITDLLKM